MSTFEQLKTRMQRRRISNKSYEKFCAGDWRLESPNIHELDGRLKELISRGYRVTTGWTATAIRGYHTRWIIWKPNNP